MNALLQQYGLTRTKLAVIAGLVAMLLGVWGNALFQGGSSTAAKRPPQPRPAARPPATRTPTPLSEKENPAKPVLRVQRSFAETPIEQITGRDPFDRPRWAQSRTAAARRVSRPSLSEREALLADLRGEGVTMVLLSGDEKIAMIGDRQYRRGDTLSGFRVIDITAAGVVLSEHRIDR